jgi:hypothetical protein
MKRDFMGKKRELSCNKRGNTKDNCVNPNGLIKAHNKQLIPNLNKRSLIVFEVM